MPIRDRAATAFIACAIFVGCSSGKDRPDAANDGDRPDPPDAHADAADAGSDGRSDGGMDSAPDAMSDARTDADADRVWECEPSCGDGETCCPEGLGTSCIPSSALVRGSCPLPDLSVDKEALESSVYFEWKYFPPGDCAIAEGCITETGWRRLLRFDTVTPNTGTGDLFLGEPDRSNPVFEYSGCHDHFHFNGYADYRLLDMNGVEVGRGHKQAFCLLDSARIDDDAEPRERYTCNYQGIQRGWSDVYGSELDCQWIDVTDVGPGEYGLRVTINGAGTLPEVTMENNIETGRVTIPPDSASDPRTPCDRDGPNEESEYRECGWVIALENQNCTPRADYYIGCAEGCGLGGMPQCANDPVLRVCADGNACNARDSLASVDDDPECGDHCPRARFTCPGGGHFTALTAPYRDGDSYVCVPAFARAL